MYLYSLPKTVNSHKIIRIVQYSFSQYIVGELTVNQLIGFYCCSFTVLPLTSLLIFYREGHLGTFCLQFLNTIN